MILVDQEEYAALSYPAIHNFRSSLAKGFRDDWTTDRSYVHERRRDIYIKSAALLESAKAEFLSNGVTGFQYEFLSLKFMASLIHNAVCREWHNLTVYPTIEEASKLLSFGPIILKLFEAHRWYSPSWQQKAS